MKEIRTEVDIKAPAERVWNILMDFSKYPDWNPFIRKVTGEAEVGKKLNVHIEPTGAKGYNFKPRVTKVVPNRELRWKGGFFIPGIFEGEHIFTIEPITAGRVLFIQREIYTGFLVPFLAHTLDTDIRRGFEEMNRALEKRAETGQ